MDKGIFATVEHRRLMELKNCGAIDCVQLAGLAELMFFDIKDAIKERRASGEKKSWFYRLVSCDLPIEQQVDLMFPERKDLVLHLSEVDVPSELCPIEDDLKKRFLFLDRAARYAREAQKVLDMFKRHHDVIVDSDRSLVIEWVLQNQAAIRCEIGKGV